MFRNRFLGGGFGPLVMFRPDDGSGGGSVGGDSGAAAAAAAAAAAGSGAAGTGEQGTTLAGGADAGSAAAAAAAAASAKPGELPKDFDFRSYLANGDKDAERDLAKYTDPRAVYKSLRELQAKISKGELKAPPAPLAADASDEQKAEYRKTNGLPDKPEGYVEKLALPAGVVIGEADKPLLQDFAKTALDKGWSPAQFNDAVSWFYEAQEAVEAQRAELDQTSMTTAQAELMTEWGTDFKANMNALGTLWSTMPEGFKDVLFSARAADGRMLGNTPELLRWGAQLARELNPAATLMPAGQGNADGIAGELKNIEAVMAKAASGDRDAHREYYGFAGKPGLEVRYRELVDAQQRMSARGKAA